MNVIGHETVAEQQHLVQPKVLLQQLQINPAIRIAIKKETTAIAALGQVVRYANGYDSGQSSHNSNSSKKTLDKVPFRFKPSSSSNPKIIGKLSVRPRVSPVPGSHGTLWLHAGGTNPGSNSTHSP